MNLSVRFLPEARQDVIDSRDWYEQQQEGLGWTRSRGARFLLDRPETHVAHECSILVMVKRIPSLTS